jgi:type II secretory pathway pseudopilin PulG
MRRSSRTPAAFSLVEIVIALGVAAFCLLAVFGLVPVALKTQQASIQQTTANEIISQVAADLRASVRYPPGLAAQLNDNQKILRGHWAQVGTPDWLYFTNEAVQTGGVSPGSVPADGVFIARLIYRQPPTDTTSLADIVVSWPAAAVNPTTGAGTPAGSVETFIAINR